MSNRFTGSLIAALLVCWCGIAAARTVTVTTRADFIGQYELFEITARVQQPANGNPFRDMSLLAVFTPAGGEDIPVQGFCDSPDGAVFRLRFCPTIPENAPRGADKRLLPFKYAFHGVFTDVDGTVPFSGSFTVTNGTNPGPVIVNPKNPRHFIFAGTRWPYFHLGYTALFLLDPHNTRAEIADALDAIVKAGYTKVRFLLIGQWRKDVLLGPLPAWPIQPDGAVDYERFNAAYWQRVDAAVEFLQDRNVVAECILLGPGVDTAPKFTWGSEHEDAFIRYAVARLSAFSNVWFNLGYEYNDQRPGFLGAAKLEQTLRDADHYQRLVTVLPDERLAWNEQAWISFIEEQFFGNPLKLNQRAQEAMVANKPYVNESYGWPETPGKAFGTAEELRRDHWAITMGGGYGTYTDGTELAYLTGKPGRGAAKKTLPLLRRLLEATPYWELTPNNAIVDGDAMCLTNGEDVYLVYLPNGRTTSLNLKGRKAPLGVDAARGTDVMLWWNPRTGQTESMNMFPGKERLLLTPPTAQDDWVMLLASQARYVEISRWLPRAETAQP